MFNLKSLPRRCKNLCLFSQNSATLFNLMGIIHLVVDRVNPRSLNQICILKVKITKSRINNKRCMPQVSSNKRRFNNQTCMPHVSTIKRRFNNQTCMPQVRSMKSRFNNLTRMPQVISNKSRFNNQRCMARVSRRFNHSYQLALSPNNKKTLEHSTACSNKFGLNLNKGRCKKKTNSI